MGEVIWEVRGIIQIRERGKKREEIADFRRKEKRKPGEEGVKRLFELLMSSRGKPSATGKKENR